ncbi:MAG TPA: hypothetical protein DEO70_12200 [Bacteroidales bacterium]|nr:MAG: hypothetical protein A2X11_10190 [Bacteroidetes bacterium GWE2_42_24]OFY25880.1 MAG: hypothetical protein A2X09_09565 [Bacteroidetes bacterium GWF2_43_11]HBZ67590.1 hypothetical protein [Bacteroidales bacterium]
MKKNHMAMTPNGAPVLVNETQTTTNINQVEQQQEAREQATKQNTNPKVEQPPLEPTATDVPQLEETEAKEVKTQQMKPWQNDPRTAAQLIAQMQQKMDERQKLIQRFNELETKHSRFSEALEVLNPDTCEVVLLVNGNRFTSTDPAAVRRFITFQIDSYTTELGSVANLLLM